MLTCACSLLLLFLVPFVAAQQLNETVPEYVKQCKSNDPELTKCVIESLIHLRPYLQKGIPEIAMPSVEPFKTDQLALSLSSGPNGYKIVLRELEIYGASNFTVESLRLGKNNKPFEGRLRIPQLRIAARYTSSGVLIILPASGNGQFFAQFNDVTALVRGLGIRERGLQGVENEEYLQIKDLDVDLDIKKVDMNVKKLFNNNRILNFIIQVAHASYTLNEIKYNKAYLQMLIYLFPAEATNLFLSENGSEVLRHMMPQLRRKISALFSDVANQLLANVPLRVFIV